MAAADVAKINQKCRFTNSCMFLFIIFMGLMRYVCVGGRDSMPTNFNLCKYASRWIRLKNTESVMIPFSFLILRTC